MFGGPQAHTQIQWLRHPHHIVVLMCSVMIKYIKRMQSKSAEGKGSKSIENQAQVLRVLSQWSHTGYISFPQGQREWNVLHKGTPWDSGLWLLLGCGHEGTLCPYQNSQTPIWKEGVQCGPYRLCKQFRHLDSLLSVRVVGTLLKSKFATVWVGFHKTATRPALFCTLTKENRVVLYQRILFKTWPSCKWRMNICQGLT